MKHFYKVFSFAIIAIAISSSLNTIKVLAAPTLDVVSSLVSTGTAPFNADDTAGNDSSASNNIVRTQDSFVVKYDYSVNGENATNAYIDIAVPAGIYSETIPPNCIAGTIPRTNATFAGIYHCVLGNVTAGTTNSFLLTYYNYSAGFPLPNGFAFTMTPTFYADSASVVGTAVTVLNSSQPRSDLRVSALAAVAQPGPLGEPGYVITTRISRVFTNPGGIGYLPLDDTTTDYKLDLTYPNTGGPYAGGQLYTWGTTEFACTDFVTQINNCTQSGGQGTTISVDNIPTYTQEDVKIWIPATDVQAAPAQSLNLTLTASNYDPNGINGSSNYGTGIEDLSNNSRSINLQVNFGSTFTKINISGLPAILAGGDAAWWNILSNTGNTFPLTDVIICDKIDTSTHTFKAANTEITYNSIFSSVGSTIEYAASANSPDNQTATCNDGDGPWYSSVGAVPGGATAITKVRAKDIVGGVLPGRDLYLKVTTTLKTTLTDGTTVFNYGSATTDSGSNYMHHTATAISTTNLLFLTLNPNNTIKNAGELVSYGLTANTQSYLTNQNLTNTIVQTLPQYIAYEPGSASVEPDSVVVNPDNTTTITWIYNPILAPGSPPMHQIQIQFFGRVKNSSPANAVAVSIATISNPLVTLPDVFSLRTQYSTVNIQNTNAFFIENIANQGYILPDQNFSYNINYGNLSATNINDLDLIDIIPYNGDGLSPASNFTGTLNFSNITVNNGESVLYTKTAFSDLSNDPCSPSNIPLGLTSPVCNPLIIGTGTTTWCPSLSGGNCPANNSEVTAIRVITQNLAAGASRTYTLEFTPTGNTANNIYANRATGRASNLALVVYSNSSSATVSLGSISGKIWDDADQSGTINNGETGITNVQVTLNRVEGANNVTVGSINTNSSGDYVFSNLSPGEYFITVTKPAQSDPTFDPDGLLTPDEVSNQNLIFNVSSGSSNLAGLNFGYSASPVTPVVPTASGGTTISLSNNKSKSSNSNSDPNFVTNSNSSTDSKAGQSSNNTQNNQSNNCPQNSCSLNQKSSTTSKTNNVLVRTGGELNTNLAATLSFLILLIVLMVNLNNHNPEEE